MTITLAPGARSGCVTVPASKSEAHRLLICAALGGSPVELLCGGASADILATAACLRALGADIRENTLERFSVKPCDVIPHDEARLPCGESGSTLRFLLPLVGALGARAVFEMQGRLPERPLAPLDAVLREHGMRIERRGALLHCAGRLTPGAFSLPGNVSSQYISGLLMALPRLGGDSVLTVTGPLESAGYVAMTEAALRAAGIDFEKQRQTWRIPGGQVCRLPAEMRVEGDWSGAAFFLCAGALSPEGVTVRGLSLSSAQGDRAVLDVLCAFGAEIETAADAVTVRRGTLRGVTIDAGPIPDLIPVLSVVAAVSAGVTRIENAGRLRLKESDRLKSTAALLRALGGRVTELESGLVIEGRDALTGGTADPWRDHRIAMAAAVAATVSTAPVTIPDSECAAKSYPRFWDDFQQLKGGSA